MADFTRFQSEIYPEWEQLYRCGQGPGEFSFERGGPTSLYGTTDMLISRATMGILTEEPGNRAEWAQTINRFQDPATGWYRKTYTRTHPKEHTTAYALAALTLIDQRPAHQISWTQELLANPAARRRWLRRVPWSVIWMGSHIVAGRPAIMTMTGEITDEFIDWYFDWLDRRVDPRSGFWARGAAHRLGINRTPTKHEMGGAFHMYFIYEHFGRRWQYPERVIDHCLRLQRPNGFWDGEYTYCIDLDAIYSMNRSLRHVPGYREEEVRASFLRYLSAAEALLNDRDRFMHHYTDSHRLPGALSAIAECSLAYPQLVTTPTPWVQTLDRALYI